MNQLLDRDYLKTFLRNSGLRPKDYLGQNFLVDEVALKNIILAADIKSSDTILEVGPGLGVLTEELAKRAGKVIAVEKDPKLVRILQATSTKLTIVTFVEGDILKFRPEEHITGPYKVVANIPYYLTSKLFQFFLEPVSTRNDSGQSSRGGKNNPPESLVLMVQKEVGERVVAAPGELSILGISVQVYAAAEIKAYVPKTSFWPVPEVDSVILKITPRDKYPEIKDKKLFFRILKIAFAGKRKQIHNTLSSGLHLGKEQIRELLTKSGIDGAMRPQDLKIEQWIELYKSINVGL